MKINLIILTLVFAGMQPVRAQTWTQTSAISNNWKFVATSADGTRMVALDSLYGVYGSTNSGKTWQSATNGPLIAYYTWWSSLTASADGSKGGNCLLRHHRPRQRRNVCLDQFRPRLGEDEQDDATECGCLFGRWHQNSGLGLLYLIFDQFRI